MANTICIYHGNCADGFGAAWVVKEWAMKQNTFRDFEFYPGVYQKPPPDVRGKNVIMVDFSYKRDVVDEMCRVAKSVTIIDHHKSAIEDLCQGWIPPNNLITCFSTKNSGAMLTWKYYFEHLEPPQLLKHIEDRDLWRFKLPNTREIQAALFSYPYEFSLWDHLMKPEELPTLITEGAAIERKHFKDIYELLEVTKRLAHIAGYLVPVANLPYTLASDAGDIMCKEHPDAAFAATYYDKVDARVFSLRSLDTGPESFDVSAIAVQYGGGGHRNASGFFVHRDHELAKF